MRQRHRVQIRKQDLVDRTAGVLERRRALKCAGSAPILDDVFNKLPDAPFISLR
ncbi:hypothetical protein D3C72_2227160 [compost metagenome]